ncbi:hypothetical protein TNCV_3180751 [Trichonephila clavipes]|nr:hypothetical protein TNCV_3180751 [Trichonephila clavipes]
MNSRRERLLANLRLSPFRFLSFSKVLKFFGSTFTSSKNLTKILADYLLQLLHLKNHRKDFLCLENDHIFGGDQGDTPENMDEILTTARDLELEVNEDDIEELIMRHEDELTIELQEILNEEPQETQ